MGLSLIAFKGKGERVGLQKEHRTNISLDKKWDFLYFEFKIQNSKFKIYFPQSLLRYKRKQEKYYGKIRKHTRKPRP
jgi:hypothetical protein